MSEFTHFDEQGNAYMVDVSGKGITKRTAVAQGTIHVSRERRRDALLPPPDGRRILPAFSRFEAATSG